MDAQIFRIVYNSCTEITIKMVFLSLPDAFQLPDACIA